MNKIFQVWWPLAASWLLMGVEMPALSAVLARLANPEIHLAAYGGIVFPLALIIESPIIMLLAASTALSKDWASYKKIYRFMMWTSAALTGLHILVAFTPVYYFVVRNIIGSPEVIVEPARIGLMIMTPWTWAIAYRRFNQGVLIRFGYSKVVSKGTIIRLTADILVLIIGYSMRTLPGIIVGTSAVAAGVIAEAVFIGIAVQPALRDDLRTAPVISPALDFIPFLRFYFPLVMTSLITLLAQPLGSAAVSRMPLALESLAAWPVVSGLLFMIRSLGIALNEVVVATLDQPGSSQMLRRFSLILGTGSTMVFILLAMTGLSRVWFENISALSPTLSILARNSLWIGIILPYLATMQSWYQGAILYSGKTRGITESVVIYLASSTLVLVIGVFFQKWPGLYIGIAALTVGSLIQNGWLWLRSRSVLRDVTHRDSILSTNSEFVPAE